VIEGFFALLTYKDYNARCTLPDRRHRVHTRILLGEPSMIAFTLRKFGAHFLLL